MSKNEETLYSEISKLRSEINEAKAKYIYPLETKLEQVLDELRQVRRDAGLSTCCGEKLYFEMSDGFSYCTKCFRRD
jgi:hypothetical protein